MASALRIWESSSPSTYRWLQWKTLLGDLPANGIILAVGNNLSNKQFTEDDPDLPTDQTFNYYTGKRPIFTSLDARFSGEMNDFFSHDDMVITTLCVPPLPFLRAKSFAFNTKPDDLSQIVLLQGDEERVDLQLGAVLCVQYLEDDDTRSFLRDIKGEFENVSILAGVSDELGTTDPMDNGSSLVVGISFFVGQGATTSVYLVDYTQGSQKILEKISQDAKPYKNGFVFVFSHDGRASSRVLEHDPDGSVWEFSFSPASKVNEFCSALQKRLTGHPIIGLDSINPLSVNTVSSNADENNINGVCFGILVVSYD